MHALGLRERQCPQPVSRGADRQRATGVSYPDAYRFATQLFNWL